MLGLGGMFAVVVSECRLQGKLRGDLDVKSKRYYTNLRDVVGRVSMLGRKERGREGENYCVVGGMGGGR